MKQIYLVMEVSNDYGGRYDGVVAAFTDLELAMRCCRGDQEIFGVCGDVWGQSIPLYETEGEAAETLALAAKEREEEEKRQRVSKRIEEEKELAILERHELARMKAEIEAAMNNPETVRALSRQLNLKGE